MKDAEPNRSSPNLSTELSGYDSPEIQNAVSVHSDDQQSRGLSLFEKLSQTDLAEPILRAGTHVLSIALVLLVVWVMRHFYLQTQDTEPQSAAVFAANLPTPTPTSLPPSLSPYQPADIYAAGISRRAQVNTTIPTRPRTEITEYEVQKGDTIFGIAEKFGLKPETILWGNYYILSDNPHSLTPGQVLNILPADGTYHKWSAGEGLNGVANGYNVSVEEIVNWSGNHLNPKTIGDPAHPDIEPCLFLFVPGESAISSPGAHHVLHAMIQEQPVSLVLAPAGSLRMELLVLGLSSGPAATITFPDTITLRGPITLALTSMVMKGIRSGQLTTAWWSTRGGITSVTATSSSSTTATVGRPFTPTSAASLWPAVRVSSRAAPSALWAAQVNPAAPTCTTK